MTPPPRHLRLPLLHPVTTTSLLLLLLLVVVVVASADDTAAQEEEDKRTTTVGMMTVQQHVDDETAPWLDRFAETHSHQPLGAATKGPLMMRRATDEEAHVLERLARPAEREGAGAGGNKVLQFQRDNPYYHAIKAWANRLIKESGGIKIVDAPHVEKEFYDVLDS